MEVPQVLHMNGGEGKNSYSKNSLYQKKVMLKAIPILKQSIGELCEKSFAQSECLTMADFGCSSGPNTLLPLLEITETIISTCNKLNKKPPMLLYFLNDLPGNDFNTIFTSLLPDFHLKGGKFEQCLVAAMPGNFYERLFPSNSLHFVHSSSSLHWSSQVPEGMVDEFGIPLNKGNICLDESSPTSVQKAYRNQFKKDFTKFLKSRSEEMVSGGHMVITLPAKSVENPNCKYGCEFWHLIANSLKEMVDEGMIEESRLDSFNVTFNPPHVEDVTNLIEINGSFSIKRIEEFELTWDANIDDGDDELVFDKWERGKFVAGYIRAATEPMVASHFGDCIIDDLFYRFCLKAANYLEKGIGLHNTLVVSVIRK